MRALLALLALVAACANPAPAPEELRVLSWNIHHGEGTDGVFDLERFAARIRAERPDFVGLQEVDVKTGRAGGVDQLAELARLTGMTGGFAEAMPYDGGSYGEGWLTPWPVLKAEDLELPWQEGREPRAVARVTIDHPSGPVTFLTTHLDHVRDPGLREQQCTALASMKGDILLGDLNAEPHSAAITSLASGWRLELPPALPPRTAHLPLRRAGQDHRLRTARRRLTVEADLAHHPRRARRLRPPAAARDPAPLTLRRDSRDAQRRRRIDALRLGQVRHHDLRVHERADVGGIRRDGDAGLRVTGAVECEP